jgi:hypothetical protein
MFNNIERQFRSTLVIKIEEINMARSRAKLSDKLERIMVQSQLMGLTTADMITIANRMKALDKEREFRKKVDEAVIGFSWEKKDRNHYIVTCPKGRVFDCTRHFNSRSSWGYYSEAWDVVITYKEKRKQLARETLHESQSEAASMCPDKDKRLWRIINAIHNGRWK